jgi:hypothetical protein
LEAPYSYAYLVLVSFGGSCSVFEYPRCVRMRERVCTKGRKHDSDVIICIGDEREGFVYIGQGADDEMRLHGRSENLMSILCFSLRMLYLGF